MFLIQFKIETTNLNKTKGRLLRSRNRINIRKMASKNLSNIPLSVLDLAPVVEGKTPADTLKNSLDLAIKAEQLGYKRFWLAEHHNMPGVASSATSVLIGYIAGGTSTIRVGAGGIMLPNHAPLIIAEQFGTLATLYPHRIDLGLGRAPGTDQLTARALNRDPQAALEFPQHVQELRTYLSAENSTAPVRAIPGEGLDIPIWILGSSTDSAYLAAALGLPYAFASHFAPAQLHAALHIYRENFRPSALLDAPHTLACVNVVAATTDAQADLLATSFKRLFLGIITGKRGLLQRPHESLRLNVMEEAALAQMTAYSFIGGPDKVYYGMQDFLEATQVDELMVVSYIYEHEARVHSYEILQQIQDK